MLLPPTLWPRWPRDARCRNALPHWPPRGCAPAREHRIPGKGIHIGIVAEEIITFVGVFLWSEPCHVVDHAEHRNIDFGVAEHGYTLARIGNGHFLGVVTTTAPVSARV